MTFAIDLCYDLSPKSGLSSLYMFSHKKQERDQIWRQEAVRGSFLQILFRQSLFHNNWLRVAVLYTIYIIRDDQVYKFINTFLQHAF